MYSSNRDQINNMQIICIQNVYLNGGNDVPFEEQNNEKQINEPITKTEPINQQPRTTNEPETKRTRPRIVTGQKE
ncbi:hypothetical protein Fmac_016633 [Flemingia macrophylla]|uniref:Uncharacterized protein n=1 Tax=Flemingia macrophylla TaxID=520843 RepID=A0ABD1MK39_9FABA